jgi:hypothetical protein
MKLINKLKKDLEKILLDYSEKDYTKPRVWVMDVDESCYLLNEFSIINEEDIKQRHIGAKTAIYEIIKKLEKYETNKL